MKLIAENTIPYLKGIPEQFAEVTYLDNREFTHSNIKDADVLIIRSINKCTRQVLENTNIKLITTATIGFDHIDTAFCDSNGIKWQNCPGCNARSVAQYVLSSLLLTALRTHTILKGKTIGIIGMGHVGKEVERLCNAYGLHILRNDPPREKAEGSNNFVSLETIAREADIITVHTPITKEAPYPTYHLIDNHFLSTLHKKPWMINAARGGVWHTEDIVTARKKGLISELITDCWEGEPTISSGLLAASSIATPHIAGFSADGKANATRMCLENIKKFFHLSQLDTSRVVPPPLENPVIDLDSFSQSRVENAILHTFDPQQVDKQLKAHPGLFEKLRADYVHPREFEAYTIKNAAPEEAALLNRLGFSIL